MDAHFHLKTSDNLVWPLVIKGRLILLELAPMMIPFPVNPGAL
jgi:hypothetical protein